MANRRGIQLAYPYEEKRFKRWQSIGIIQPKLDGERCRAIIDGQSVSLLSSSEELIMSVPHINDHLRSLFAGRQMELDGELYIHHKPLQEIHSIVSRKRNLHEDADTVQYWVFDVVTSEPQVQRMRRVELLPTSDILKPVPSWFVHSTEEVMMYYERFLASDYEGFILRHPLSSYVRKRSTLMMKFKPWQSDIYTILDVQEEISKDGIPKGSLGALILDSDIEGQTFKVGSGFTEEERRELWKIRSTLPGCLCKVNYQRLTNAKIPTHPYFSHEIFTPDAQPLKY